ncbi:hypothetical protein NQZ68_021032 [Dissostichus eleginoides]|nr:hypothetical protein NQZ68_021032 [Dissostichus eleginoides]
MQTPSPHGKVTSLPLRGVTLIEQQFILLDLRCDSVLFCALFPPLSPLCCGLTIRPSAPNLPTGAREPRCCQVTSSQQTNPHCQRPASTTNTPELGHASHCCPGLTGLESADCCVNPRGRPSYHWHQIPVDSRSPVNAVQAALQLAFRAVPSLVPVALSPKGNSHRDNGQLTRPSLEPLKKDWALTGLLVLKVLGARWGLFRPVSFGVGGRRRCIVPFGVAVAAARMGSFVLRLCRTSTPFANPPVGGCMPVNYCTLGEKKEGRRKREGDEEHRKKKKKTQKKQKKKRRWGERQRERSPLGCDYEMVCHRLRLQGCRQR